MSFELISSQREFDELCKRLASSSSIAFDTEFISEHTYRPQLCLLQFATEQEEIAVDPLDNIDLTAWWEIMASPDHQVIIHGGREEILFCWHAIGKKPENLIDIQIVQGLLSRGFPLSHSAIVERVVQKRIVGKETRTDWSKRPLTTKQIEYAIEDVRYLTDIYKKQQRRLKKLNRVEWAEEECRQFISGLVESQQERLDAWLKLPKIGRLSRRGMGTARELFRWREEMADQMNRPVRTILRDDLLVDLAHRQPRSESEVLSTRDMQRGNYRRHAEDLVAVIQEAKKIPDEELPEKPQRRKNDHSRNDEHVLGKLLGIALANRCAEVDLSASMIGTASDLREFATWHSGGKKGPPPRLAKGWRYEVCGEMLEDLLEGRVALRVADAQSENPLAFESWTSER